MRMLRNGEKEEPNEETRIAALLTGCTRVSYGGQGQSLAVWSFHGENDDIAVENGVIVISPDTETLYGGNLTVKTDAFEFDEVTAYTVRIKLDTGEEWRPLLVNTVSTADAAGTSIGVSDFIGQTTGDVFAGTDAEFFPGGLRFELDVADLSGALHTYQVPLQVTQIME